MCVFSLKHIITLFKHLSASSRDWRRNVVSDIFELQLDPYAHIKKLMENINELNSTVWIATILFIKTLFLTCVFSRLAFQSGRSLQKILPSLQQSTKLFRKNIFGVQEEYFLTEATIIMLKKAMNVYLFYQKFFLEYITIFKFLRQLITVLNYWNLWYKLRNIFNKLQDSSRL